MTKHFANCKMLYNNDFCHLLKRLFDNDTESAASHKDTHYRGIESLSLPFSVPWSIWGRSSRRNPLFTLLLANVGARRKAKHMHSHVCTSAPPPPSARLLPHFLPGPFTTSFPSPIKSQQKEQGRKEE